MRPGSWPSSAPRSARAARSEEHTSELQSRLHLVCRLLLEKKKKIPFPHSRRLSLYSVPTYQTSCGDCLRQHRSSYVSMMNEVCLSCLQLYTTASAACRIS